MYMSIMGSGVRAEDTSRAHAITVTTSRTAYATTGARARAAVSTGLAADSGADRPSILGIYPAVGTLSTPDADRPAGWSRRDGAGRSFAQEPFRDSSASFSA